VLGDEVVSNAEDEVARFREAAEALGVGLVADGLCPVDVAMADGSRLRGAVPSHDSDGGRGPLTVHYSRPKPHHVVLLAARLLAVTATASGDDGWRAVSIHRGEKAGKPPTVHELTVVGSSARERQHVARAALGELVELWDLGLRLPLPLFDSTSYLLAHGGWPAALDAWEGDRGDGSKPAVQLAFGARSLEELRRLEVLADAPDRWAERLWSTVQGSVVDHGASLW
jgi:exonuclease V gamma subunit